jgi:hypothetical protein
VRCYSTDSGDEIDAGRRIAVDFSASSARLIRIIVALVPYNELKLSESPHGCPRSTVTSYPFT